MVRRVIRKLTTPTGFMIGFIRRLPKATRSRISSRVRPVPADRSWKVHRISQPLGSVRRTGRP
jgi:hypothetical protein